MGIRSTLGHIADQPFVAATALAAFWHSTVVLAMIFSGPEPEEMVAKILWILPAALIAFALDIGQVATASEIKRGAKTKAKFATFIVFAVATYYLQFLYLVLHVPLMNLGKGVAPEHQGVVTTLVNASIYIIPALLPLSTLLYSFSHRSVPLTQAQEVKQAVDIVVATPVGKPLPEPKKVELGKYITANPDGTYTVRSPKGHILRDKPYPNYGRAEGALRLHLRSLDRAQKRMQPTLPPVTGSKDDLSNHKEKA